jgi:hypothetical protein
VVVWGEATSQHGPDIWETPPMLLLLTIM